MKLVLPTIAVTLFLLLVFSCGGTGGGSGASEEEEETTSSSSSSTSSSSEGTSAVTQETTTSTSNAAATVTLAPMNGSSTTGTASFTDTADGVSIELSVLDLPAPDVTYLTYIHSGTCADEQGEEEEPGSDHEHEHTGYEGTSEEIEYPLPPITADPQGQGSTTSVLTGFTVQRLFSGEPKYINVHAEGSGNPLALACGQLAGTG